MTTVWKSFEELIGVSTPEEVKKRAIRLSAEKAELAAMENTGRRGKLIKKDLRMKKKKRAKKTKTCGVIRKCISLM